VVELYPTIVENPPVVPVATYVVNVWPAFVEKENAPAPALAPVALMGIITVVPLIMAGVPNVEVAGKNDEETVGGPYNESF